MDGMMTERERLIDLLECADDVQKEHKPTDMQEFYSNVAGYLLDNGVILPPCKVGDKVYYICEEFEEYGGNYVSELTITEISNVRFWVENEDENHFRFTDIGKTVFLTREEAEAANRKTEDNNE